MIHEVVAVDSLARKCRCKHRKAEREGDRVGVWVRMEEDGWTVGTAAVHDINRGELYEKNNGSESDAMSLVRR